MSAATYPVGTVAVATVCSVKNVRAFRYEDTSGETFWWVATPVRDRLQHEDSDVTDVHPLAVLYLSALEIPDFVDSLRGGLGGPVACRVADAIEYQTRPPKPAEPTGLGAVVECRDHSPLTRASTAIRGELVWVGNNGDWHTWDELDVVKVLSEGWTP